MVNKEIQIIRAILKILKIEIIGVPGLSRGGPGPYGVQGLKIKGPGLGPLPKIKGKIRIFSIVHATLSVEPSVVSQSRC